MINFKSTPKPDELPKMEYFGWDFWFSKFSDAWASV